MKVKILFLLVVVGGVLFYFSRKTSVVAQEVGFQISSSAFDSGKPIPKKYTCDGENIPPPLTWSGFPANTKSFAIICDDPDAPSGTWVHWVVWNIPAAVTSFDENKVPDGCVQGTSDFKKVGYGGPCPPSGTHRYFFKIYALSVASLRLYPTATKQDLLDAIKDCTLAKHEAFYGTYARG